MNRRFFLQFASGLTGSLRLSSANFNSSGSTASPEWRVFEVTTRIEVLKPSGTTRIWAPNALLSNTPFQRTISNAFRCEGGTAKTFESKREALGILVADFPAGSRPLLTVTSRVATRNWTVIPSLNPNARKQKSGDLRGFLQPTKSIPTDSIVKQRATEITKGARTDIEKARAIYEWIVDNTYRNPKTRGCGIGNIRFMLESGDLGGKCADLNALYVGLARAAGLPARDVYGIRVARLEMGYHSLGPTTENVTKAQHCRAEVYLSDYGWTPVDPADVRKVMLEEPPGNLRADDPIVKKARKQMFGSWEMNWMAYNFAQDVVLPGSTGEVVRFFMYPQAEISGRRIDSLDPDAFHYEISSKEIKPAKADLSGGLSEEE